MEPIYPTQPETLIPEKYARLIAELAAVESLFEMRLGVTVNCGDIRLVRPVDGRYIVQEQRHMKNGTAEYRHVSTHADIANATIAFRAGVVGHPMPQTAPQTCEWRIDDDWQEDTVYKTTCGHLYQFVDCDISESEFKFCPYCGYNRIMSKLSIATAKYSDRHIITRNRRRLRPLYRNMPKYTIDRDTWLARHGGGKSIFRSSRARQARHESELFRSGMSRLFVYKWRKNIEARASAKPHPKFKSC